MQDRGEKRSDALRLGILGLGNAGRAAIRASRSSEFVEVVAVCDQSVETAMSFERETGVASCTQVRDLGANPDVEVVYVATPTFLHLPHALELAMSGKHLMIEKPLVRDSNEGEALLEIVADTGVHLMSVNTRGRDAPVRAMARLVAEGAIGRVLAFTNITYTNWVLRPRYPYELVSGLGGGVVFRQAPHQIEIARTVLDASVTAVTAMASCSSHPVETVGNFNALVEFDNDQSGSLIFNGYGFFDTAELTYGFGEGGYRYDPEASVKMRLAKAWNQDKYGEFGLERSRPNSPSPTSSPSWSFVGFTLISGEKGDIRQSPGGLTVYDEAGSHEVPCLDEPGGLGVDFEEFYRFFRHGENLIHDAKWGVHTVDACEAIWRSHRERRRVVLAK